MTDIGHNKPPDMTETAGDVSRGLNEWLSSHPVIQTENDAREARPLIDRAKLCIADLENERKGKVIPLNEEVAKINNYYRGPRELLERIYSELSSRLGRYLAAEEARRRAIAEEARRQAEEKERLAREAEKAEAEVIADAEMGVEVDLLAATQEADAAFKDYEKADRVAARAERDSKVRIGGGLTGRALALRSYETLVVENWLAAVTEMGLTDDIRQAICKSARAYRKLRGKLPSGVVAEVEKRL